MYESMKTSLANWNDTTSDRDKLQHLYITVAIGLLIAAGIIGLLNQNLGQQILALSIASAAVFLINAVAWALLQSFILIRLKSTPALEKPTTPRKSTSRTK